MRYLRTLLILFSLLVMGCMNTKDEVENAATSELNDIGYDGGICGTMDYTKLRQSEDAGFESKEIQMEEEIADYIQANKMSVELKDKVIYIPVVVNVVYKYDIDNIDESVIQDQIDILNECFRGNNNDPDKDFAPKEFRNLKADMQIEFCLYHIQRTHTEESYFTIYNDVKFTAKDGKDAYKPTEFLNIWVCQIEGLLGYAQFPGGDPATDGVVIHSEHVGYNGILDGRVVVHEIGHWLNLRHIWGDDPGCRPDDKVKDTPKQTGYHRNCPEKAYTCDTRDMVVNYMDYTSCMNMFTKGQKERALASLKLHRKHFYKYDCDGELVPKDERVKVK